MLEVGPLSSRTLFSCELLSRAPAYPFGAAWFVTEVVMVVCCAWECPTNRVKRVTGGDISRKDAKTPSKTAARGKRRTV